MKAITLFLTVLFAGCATQTELTLKTDPYSGNEEYYLGPIPTTNCDGDENGALQWLVMGTMAGGVAIRSVYSGQRQWSFLSKELGMDIIIKGKSYNLFGNEEVRTVREWDATVEEYVTYPVTGDHIRAIIESDFVRFRMNGERRSVEACLEREQLDQLKRIEKFLI